MICKHILVFIHITKLGIALRETYSLSAKETTDILVGVLYNEYIMLESRQGMHKSVIDVVQHLQYKYQRNGTIVLEYIKYKEFKLKSFLDTQTTAVISMLSCSETWTLYQQLFDSGILVIALTGNCCTRLPPESAFSVPLLEPITDTAQILLDLRSSKVIEWKSVAIICDQTLDSTQLEILINSLMAESLDNEIKAMSTMVMVFKIEHKQANWHSRISEIVQELSKMKDHANFLVIIGVDYITSMLESMKQFRLMKPTFQWLFIIIHKVTRKILNGFRSYLSEGANVAFFYNHSSYNSHTLIEVDYQLDIIIRSLVKCLNIELKAEIDKSKKVSEDEWEKIKPSDLERKHSVLQLLKRDLHGEIPCNQCTMWKVVTSDMWGSYFVHSQEAGSFLDIGSWNSQEGCLLNDFIFPHIKYGFRAINLPLVSFHHPPWQVITYNASGHAIEFKGVVFEIMNMIAQKFNFTYSVAVPTINTHSSLIINRTNTYTVDPESGSSNNYSTARVLREQIIRLVKQKQTFLAACALSIMEHDSNLVDFTEPVGMETFVFIISKPKPLNRALLFMLPFTSDAWLCIMAAILLMSPTLYYVHTLSPFYDYNNTPKINGLDKVSNCFWCIYGALLQQGGAYLPISNSGRLIIGTWWIVVLVLVTTYCGNLVAFLTFPKMDKLITSVHDLLARKNILSWGIPETSPLNIFLSNTDDPVLKEFYIRAQFYREITPDITDSIRKGEHALVQSKYKMLYYVKEQFKSSNTCDFSFGNEELFKEKLGMMMHNQNPFIELFNKEINKMHRMGLIDKWIAMYLPKKDQCWNLAHDKEADNHTVNLDDMQGSFFILFLGVITASIVILLELAVRKIHCTKDHTLIQPFTQ